MDQIRALLCVCVYLEPLYGAAGAKLILVCSLSQSWLSDLEIFTCLIAAIIHDYDHSGTTNNFHVNSGSSLAILYNDRAVLENHHISAFFR